jgi:diguanylate cyclase (GGDEF)-like protein
MTGVSGSIVYMERIGNRTWHANGVEMEVHSSIAKDRTSPVAIVVRVGLAILCIEFGIMLVIKGVFVPLLAARVTPFFWEFLDPILLALIVAPVLYFWVLRPMKDAEAKILRLAFYDPLTQLPNRRLFSDRLSQAMAETKRTKIYCALMFLDLDNFKSLNDTQGHATGDLLLLEVAKRLKACVRAIDSVARFGGDEFVVLVGGLSSDQTTSKSQVAGIAEKIRLSLAKPYLLTVRHADQPDVVVEHRCSASMGVVVFIKQEADESDLLKWADAAMYQAKNAGRDAIRFYEELAQPLLAASGSNAVDGDPC